jgi:phosphoribosyl-ATP pyrophosphohydrolase / phosphoribosyl-AMP cyclohydrolase / histidinol dehydrogenase
MGVGLLIAVDPDAIASPKPKGLALPEVALFESCLVQATPENLQSRLSFLRESFTTLSIYFDVRQLKGWNDVVEVLNCGASKIFVTFEQLKVLSQEDTISPSRLVLTISPLNPKTDIAKLKAFLDENPKWKTAEWAFDGDKGNVYIDSVLQELDNYPPNADQTLYVSTTSESAGQDLLAQYPGNALIVPSERLTLDVSKEGHKDLILATDLFLAGAVADRKTGLYTTSVVDERGVALGLVYSSKESIVEALKTGTGVYQSRKRGLWHKGASSGDTQQLINVAFDCDKDCLLFRVRQLGRGFCHLATMSCWGPVSGLTRLQRTLQDRKKDAPPGSYTARLFNDPKLVNAKIKEEADELCEASTKEDIASEAADLLYFALARCVAADVTLEDIERNLDLKSLKVKRRKGDAKPQYVNDTPPPEPVNGVNGDHKAQDEDVKEAASVPKAPSDPAGVNGAGKIQLKRYSTSQAFSDDTLKSALQRPSQRSNEKIMGLVNPIIEDVRNKGDSAVLKYTHKFEKATSLKSPVLKAPFPKSLMQLPEETIAAIDTSYENILKFHSAQKEQAPLAISTMPGITCSRFSRPIEKVGLYIPGGTAVLPSTALMLGVPAMAAGCKNIILASPPRSDGTITPEIVYIANKVGAEAIVLAGGAQAVAAMAYGTESITKVDKILGPGNQFVTAAKMIVSNDTTAAVSIDMPAGPSEVLVIADETSQPAFVASDLLSQAEHGTDSQVVLIAIDLSEAQLQAIEDEVHRQAFALPRVDIVRGAIEHSVTISVSSLSEALKWSNYYAPEHLILQIAEPKAALPGILHAGSVFLGKWTPESVGDYSAGVNHSLPTYGYARQYSGVNLASFTKHITSSEVSEEGVKNVGSAVVELARVEGLDAHKRAMELRMEVLGLKEKTFLSDEVGVRRLADIKDPEPEPEPIKAPVAGNASTVSEKVAPASQSATATEPLTEKAIAKVDAASTGGA